MKTFLRTAALLVWLPILVVLLWRFTTEDSAAIYVPPLQVVLATFARDWFGPEFVADAVPSIMRFTAGFLLAATGGVVLGTLIGLSRRLSAALEPLIQFFRAVPPPAMLPVALLLIGFGPWLSISVIAVGAVWPTLLNTIDGIRSVDPQVRDLVASYRVGLRARIFKVLLPAASPQIFAGLRVSLQLSVILIVVAEMFASTNGIGFYVLYSQQTFGIAETWAGTILLGILGCGATLIFVLVERRVLAWHRGMTTTAERA